MAKCESFEHYCGRSAATHIQLERLHYSSGSLFSYRSTRFLDDRVTDQHAKPTTVVPSALDSPELDSSCVVELLCTGERVGAISEAIFEATGTSRVMPLVTCTTPWTDQL